MNTGRPIDHIVLAVHDLDAAAAVYQELGFTLTPRATHEDRMGTSNRIAQFAGKNFIEILEVDRPDKLEPHDFSKEPPFFSFGGQSKALLEEREGISMLVFAGEDAHADAARFNAAGVPTYEVFDFDRKARLPGGDEVTVSFSLTFATSPDMPEIAFFVCQNRAPQYFWKPEFQQHENGAQVICAVYIASPDPARDAAFVSRMFDGEVSGIDGGKAVACGAGQEVRILTPEAAMERDSSLKLTSECSPVFVGIALTSREPRVTTPAAAACGIFIEWIEIS
ncbi:VOC family protein [Denitrobaculum tricleocarpae]|uniref:VOC family protein n=1 Tax=Denitrobaculum tricleocarpae TaxID=2591009 RepID=A0A545T3X3_9PROT|nr:VOC family protein [Denitrobaculum tricleocarpae]TQV71917.1 VOC family protein [Denitrobaculum tricleocarpae]